MEEGEDYVSQTFPCVSENVRLVFLCYQLGPA